MPDDKVGWAYGPAPSWEAAWAPYDAGTYAAALAALHPTDTVLDIGAGDLRFARQAARVTRRVIAVERQHALMIGPVPANLHRICADAWALPYPQGITAAVLLMRHCQHVAQVIDKLQAIGCARLITNARWGMGLEVIDLTQPPRPLNSLTKGWYACTCGRVGFIPCDPQQLTPDDIDRVHHITSCTDCEGPA